MTFEEALIRVQEDPDFVFLKRYDYSLKKFLEKHPDGAPNDKIIATAMMMSEEEVQEVYESALAKLRKNF